MLIARMAYCDNFIYTQFSLQLIKLTVIDGKRYYYHINKSNLICSCLNYSNIIIGI